jgi:hypothetical protein
MVGFEGLQELASVSQAVDAFSEESSGDGEAVFAGAAGPAALREQGRQGDHGTDGDEEGGAAIDGADDRGEDREELLLEYGRELGVLFGQGELPGNREKNEENVMPLLRPFLPTTWPVSKRGLEFCHRPL